MCLWETWRIMLAASKKACGRAAQRVSRVSHPWSPALTPKGLCSEERPVGPRKAHDSHHPGPENCSPGLDPQRRRQAFTLASLAGKKCFSGNLTGDGAGQGYGLANNFPTGHSCPPLPFLEALGNNHAQHYIRIKRKPRQQTRQDLVSSLQQYVGS